MYKVKEFVLCTHVILSISLCASAHVQDCEECIRLNPDFGESQCLPSYRVG